MNRKKWFLLIALCAAAVLAVILLAVLLPTPAGDLPLFHQGLVPVQVGGKWGYANTRGKIVIEPQYQLVYDFDESGLAAVLPEKGSGYGFINTKGKTVIEPRFSLSGRIGFFEGLAAVQEMDGKLWGYIDPKGNYVIPPLFQYAYAFSEDGIARVSIDGESRYIDKKGNFVGASSEENYVNQKERYPHLKTVGSFAANGLARASEDYSGDQGYIDRTGTFVIPQQFAYAGDFGDNGLACIQEKQSDLYGYIDSTGFYVIPPQFDFASSFGNNPVAVVFKDDRYGIIDSQGNYVLELQDASLGSFAEDGLSIAHYPDGETVIDRTGQPLFDRRFDYLVRLWDFGRPKQAFFSDGYAVVLEDGKYGVIDKKGRYVLEPAFDYIGHFLYTEPPDCY